MFELIVNISRYLFVFYMVTFLWQGVAFILDERGLRKKGWRRFSMGQRAVICFFHITAFLILSYNPSTLAFKTETLIIGGVGLAALAAASFLTAKIYKNSCPLLWNGMFFLMDIGFVMLQRLKPELAQKQLLWIVAAATAVIVMSLFLKIIQKLGLIVPHVKTKARKLNDQPLQPESLEIICLILGLCILSLPFFFGRTIYGALNWVKIYGVSFQPSEIVKFIFVLYLASAFNRKVKLPRLIVTAAFSALFVLILVVQKDLGGALIFFMAFMTVAYIGTNSEALFLCGLSAAAGASVLAYKIFAHIQDRVLAWRNPWSDIDNKGYQIIHAMFAIGTWGFWGSGLTRGYPRYIPVNESDMIFAAICEEFGTFFGIGIICIFIMILYRGINVSLRCKTRYLCLLAAGFTCMPSFQAFLILGGVIKLIPLTGVTLPFVSYGGSSIIVSALMIGILQLVYKSNKKEEKDELHRR